MQILSIYWKGIWETTMSGRPSHIHSHSKEERISFDRRMAAMRTADRRFVHLNG
jgi:hypothetical protein